MSDSIKNLTKVAVMTEVTEGTYLTPASGTDFLQAQSDGFEINVSKELLERNNFNASIGKLKGRLSAESVDGSISVEAKAHGTAGSYPEFGPFVKSCLGTSRQNTTTVTTKASGNTASILQIEDADISKFNIGDIILVKQSAAYHVTPVTAVDSTASAANITVLVPHPSGDFTDSVVIEKFATYYTANSGHPSLSITKYEDDTKREYVAGAKVTSMSLENFTPNSLANFNFSYEGMDYSQSLTAPSYTPSYNSALPPIVVSACVYQNTTKIPVSEVSFSVENEIAWKTSTCAENGKVSSRISSRSVSGSINPYRATDSIAQFTNFDGNTSFSLFGYMGVPTSTAGEFEDVVAFYMPDCHITEYKEGDVDGLNTDELTFNATRGSAGTTEELYLSFI